MRRYRIALVVWLALLLVACGTPAAPLGPTRAGGQSASPAADDPATAERTKGDPNAPVTLIEYSDYQ